VGFLSGFLVDWLGFFSYTR